MSNKETTVKETLQSNINTLEEVRDKFLGIKSGIEDVCDEITRANNWLRDVKEDLVDLRDNQLDEKEPNHNRIFTREKQGKIEFLSSMLMITKDVFDNLPDDVDNNFVITFQIERTKYE